MRDLELKDLHITYSNYRAKGALLRELVRDICIQLRFTLPFIADSIGFNHSTFYRFMNGITDAMMYSRMIDLSEFLVKYLKIREITNEHGEPERLISFRHPEKED